MPALLGSPKLAAARGDVYTFLDADRGVDASIAQDLFEVDHATP